LRVAAGADGASTDEAQTKCADEFRQIGTGGFVHISSSSEIEL
jgi:hypothetical protein